MNRKPISRYRGVYRRWLTTKRNVRTTRLKNVSGSRCPRLHHVRMELVQVDVRLERGFRIALVFLRLQQPKRTADRLEDLCRRALRGAHDREAHACGLTRDHERSTGLQHAICLF